MTTTLRDRALAFRSLHTPGTPARPAERLGPDQRPDHRGCGSGGGRHHERGSVLVPRHGGRRPPGPRHGPHGRRPYGRRGRSTLSADIETGYGKDAAGVADTIRGVLEAGAVGVDIEDALYEPGTGPLGPVTEQSGRITAAREAADAEGVPLFVNARIDTFLRAAGGVDTTLERAAAFLAAGADGILVPGAVDPETIKALVDGIDAPPHVMAGPVATVPLWLGGPGPRLRGPEQAAHQAV